FPSPTPFRSPPADIQIMAGDAELRVKTAEGLKAIRSKSHITAGDVFGLPVREKNVSRPARRMADASRDVSVVGKRNVGTTDSGTIHLLKRVHQIAEPVRIRAGIVVKVRNNFA